jgi:hypothetical protein
VMRGERSRGERGRERRARAEFVVDRADCASGVRPTTGRARVASIAIARTRQRSSAPESARLGGLTPDRDIRQAKETGDWQGARSRANKF